MRPGINLWLSLLVFAGLNFSAGPVRAESEMTGPDAVVARLHRALETISDTAAGERHESLEAPVLETHDLDYMLQLILRGQWDKFSPEQQKQLLARFRKVSVRDYVNHFEGRFTITGQRPLNDQRVKINAQLDTSKRQVEFIYTLNRNDEGWRIVSILADGVSELALRRSEYLRHYNAEGFEGLMRALEQEAGGKGS